LRVTAGEVLSDRDAAADQARQPYGQCDSEERPDDRSRNRDDGTRPGDQRCVSHESNLTIFDNNEYR
jgi:hypothetical protein